VAAACAAARTPHALPAARAAVESPEEIDEDPETHPSARIARELPAYRKGLHGPIAAEQVGLEAMRAACRHFRAWIERLEALWPGHRASIESWRLNSYLVRLRMGRGCSYFRFTAGGGSFPSPRRM
jgi:hypothetical protein